MFSGIFTQLGFFRNLTMTLSIGVHVLAAILSLLLGSVVLLRKRKGDTLHRRLGWLWIVLMLVVVVSSFVIQLGNYWLYGLSFLTLSGLVGGVYAARNKQVQQHRRTMINLFFWSLVVAGFFTLLPSRILGKFLLP